MRACPSSPPTESRTRLVGFLVLYGAFILLGSLYPFSGWVELDGSSLQFLTAPWPRYFTRTDLATNLLSYAPLGYAFALCLSHPGHRLRGVLLGIMAGTLLSFICEAMQQLLASRIASNLDLLVNTLGASLGALLTVHHSRWLRAGAAMRRWRMRWFHMGTGTNLGLALLLLWLLAQFALVPVSGIGWLHLHLRPLDTPPESLAFLNPAWFFALFLEMLALGALTACMLKPGRYVAGMVLVFLAAFLVKLIVATILLKLVVVGGVLSIETLAAFILSFWILLLPAVSRLRHAMAVTATLLIIAIRFWLAKDFLINANLLNIVGLAKFTGALWPALAIVFLVFIGNKKTRSNPKRMPG